MNGARAERRFQQLVSAAVLGLALFMAHAAIAPWIATLVALQLVAGSLTPSFSLARRLHRYFIAPARHDPVESEDQTSFLRADAVLGTLGFAGAVFVFAGAPPPGWALVGLALALLVLDATLDANPLRLLLRRRHGKLG
jgi:hypothetical protein